MWGTSSPPSGKSLCRISVMTSASPRASSIVGESEDKWRHTLSFHSYWSNMNGLLGIQGDSVYQYMRWQPSKYGRNSSKWYGVDAC